MKIIDVRTSQDNIAYPNNKQIFDRYLSEIAKYRPLTRETEVSLFKQLELNKNDKEAYNKLYQHNLLFVVSVAKRYNKHISASTLTLEDIISEGNLGLSVAINKFDYHKGYKLISFAVWYIRQHILKSIEENIKTIKVPRHIINMVNKVNKKTEELEQTLSRKPTLVEVFENMMENDEIELDNNDIEKKDGIIKLESMMNSFNFEISLNSTVGDESTLELYQNIDNNEDSPEDILHNKELSEKLLLMLDAIPITIKNYFIDFYGLNGKTPLCLTEIGFKHDVHPRTIKRKMDKYLSFLRRKNKRNRSYFKYN